MASPAALDTEPISVFPYEGPHAAQPAFPVLEALEADRTPADTRVAAYTTSWDGARAQLEVRARSLTQELADALYDPWCAAIHHKLAMEHVGVPTVAVDGASYERVAHLVHHHAGADTVCVPMHAVQCPNLAGGIASFVSDVCAQLAEQVPLSWDTLSAAYDPNDLDLIHEVFQIAGRTPPVVLVLHSVEQFTAAVLNDFLQALLSWGHASLRLVLLYTAPLAVLPRGRMPPELHQPTTWLASLLTQRILQTLDVSSVAFPDKSAFWMRVVCPFFLRPASGLWLGRSVFELVRRRFWHVEPSWDSVAQTVRLCYLHHFSTQPLAAYVHTVPRYEAFQCHWTSEMEAALRLALVAPYVARGDPSLPEGPKHLLAQDTPHLLQALPAMRSDVHTAVGLRVVMLAAVQSLLEHTHMAGMHGTRLSYSACIATALELPVPYTDWHPGRAPAYAHTPTTPSAPHIRALLEHLASTVPGAEMGALMDRVQSELATHAAHLDASAAAVVDASRAALHKLAQRPSPTLNAAFTHWLNESWAAMHRATPTGIAAAIWTYDFASPISAALEGAARAGVLLALDAPRETLASMVAASGAASGQRLAGAQSDWPERAMGVSDLDELRATLNETQDAEVPDVCRLYALYKDSGKFINLADWFDAFLQSLEGDARARETQPDLDLVHVQVRFALAINELAYLGLLGPTGRKVEHLCRTVWDLPIDGVPETE